MHEAMGRSWHEAEDRSRKRQEQATAGGRSRQKQAEAGRRKHCSRRRQRPETEAGRSKGQEQAEVPVVGGGQWLKAAEGSDRRLEHGR